MPLVAVALGCVRCTVCSVSLCGHAVTVVEGGTVSTLHDRLRANLGRVRDRIASACAAAGRSPESVRLVAVTKYAQWSWVEELIGLGVTDLGESRPQQLERRAPLSAGRVTWHLIGHLQRNKVRKVLPLARWIHSVDSARLLDRIELIAAELQVRPRVLLEVNVSGEASKDGLSPSELLENADRWRAVRHADLCGLMTMAPLVARSSEARPYFDRLVQLRDRLREMWDDPAALPELSMGMSNDFDAAIAAGATCVRIGRALFEGLEEVDGGT
ncbi:MAG: YggS family pyridoxal phosphate-dependent enzyme [Planctomycetota bacterium]|nr:MAG: YggS family pyridoxal phosphate-dependent enzyme [Planctomycetota bacterium]